MHTELVSNIGKNVFPIAFNMVEITFKTETIKITNPAERIILIY